jgi:hypothetical protein
MYAIASIAGSWIAFIISFGDIHNPVIPISIALTGAIVMALIGFLMDQVRIRKAIWAILFVVAALVIFVISIKSYPSIERALSKNGSWWSYIFFSVNVGLYFGILLSFMEKGLEVVLKRTRKATNKELNSDAVNRSCQLQR